MQYKKAPEGSSRKAEAQKQVLEAMSHRLHVDNSVLLIGKLLFGISEGPAVLNKVRSSGKPLVDDWDCLKTLVILLNNLYSQSSSLHTVFFFLMFKLSCGFVD